MTQFNFRKSGPLVISGFLAAIAFVGCNSQPKSADDQSAGSGASSMPAPSGTAQPESGQLTFATPDAAVAALLGALQSNDHADLQKIFGAQSKDLVSGDPVEVANDYKAFADLTLERAQIEERAGNVCILHIGNQDWPFAIPICKDSRGQWFFDTVAGKNEILARRIGADELETLTICRAYVQAQREYAMQDHNGDQVPEYAQRLNSSPGQQDGLYWEAEGNTPQSPFGPLVGQAAQEGYAPISGSRRNPVPFHGYYYHILKQQGGDAPGGQYNYVINGHMIAGFALVAWPAEYRNSGVMTFIVSHQGKVFQKDLGPQTNDLASKMTEYNPDSSWTLVKD